MSKLTIEEFNKIKPGEIFGTGELSNSPDGLFMTDTRPDSMLKWIAKKGHANDWCVYCHWAENDIDYISRHGDKITMKSNILKCVDCTNEVLNLYRY